MNFPLGRIRNHDPRSLNFPAPKTGTHRPVSHRIYGPRLNQGNLGSCVGNTAAEAMNARPYHRVPSRLLTEVDAVHIYTEATKIDPFPGQMPDQDTGTDANSACKILRDMGLIAGWEHAFGLDHVLDALQERPVWLGCRWDYSMFEVDAKGFVHPNGNGAGGHETLLHADNAKGVVRGRNHWWENGKPWGLNGDYLMTYEDLDALLRDDGDAVVLNVSAP